MLPLSIAPLSRSLASEIQVLVVLRRGCKDMDAWLQGHVSWPSPLSSQMRGGSGSYCPSISNKRGDSQLVCNGSLDISSPLDNGGVKQVIDCGLLKTISISGASGIGGPVVVLLSLGYPFS